MIKQSFFYRCVVQCMNRVPRNNCSTPRIVIVRSAETQKLFSMKYILIQTVEGNLSVSTPQPYISVVDWTSNTVKRHSRGILNNKFRQVKSEGPKFTAHSIRRVFRQNL